MSLCSLTTLNSFATTEMKTAPVSGFARSFLLNVPIPNAKITVLETGLQITTDKQGHFGPILYPVGKTITFVLQKWGYKTTQSETVVVPADGLTGPYRNMTFQVPSIESYYLLAAIIGAKIDENACHVATTIIAHHKTLDDLPQGEADAEVTLIPANKDRPFYFDLFETGPFKHKTNPFTRNLVKTSLDGGVAFFNLPPRNKPYTISAKKNGLSFSKAQFLCRKGMFINISPPRGPMVVQK